MTAFFSGMETSLKLKYNNVLILNLTEENVVDYETKLAKIFGKSFNIHFTGIRLSFKIK